MARPKVILEYACISARVRPDIRKAFAILAEQKGKTSSALANQILSAYVCQATKAQKTTKKKLIEKKLGELSKRKSQSWVTLNGISELSMWFGRVFPI